MEEDISFRLEEIIDFSLLQDLQEKLNEVYSFPSAIIDNEGNIKTAVAWQDICTKFHRKNPICEKECIKSDKYILEHLHEANPAVSYQCPHGLVDNATPIIIDGKHVGNFFTGQFFLEKPDMEFFRIQAHRYGFDEKEYLEAVAKVPIWTKEKLAIYLDFIKGFIQIIAGLGLKNLKEKEINERLLKSEERFRLVVENSADMVTLHDSEGKYLFYSGPEKYGITLADVIGKTPHDFFEKEIADQIVEQIKKTAQNGEHKKIEIHVNWQGKMTWFEENIYPLIKENKIISVVKICSDISIRKNSELELIAAKEKAEESDRLKTAFLQNMSHEIRTPMNAIMGFAELLPRNYNNKAKLENFSAIINQRCADLLDIINDLLDISKIESGQLTANYEQCNVSKLLSEISSFFSEHQNRLNKNHISFEIVSHCKINDLIISTDTVKLKQIFINLLTNAFKFTYSGKVEAGCHTISDQELIFYVSDTGIGIPADKHQFIFERFSQLQFKETRLHGGNGLGLSIVKGLVKLLGGRVWLESELGKGTTFYFSIDYKKHATHDTLILEPYVSKNGNTLTNKTVLIVEDDTYNMSLLVEILSGTGLKILNATNAKEAIQKAEEYLPDLILMDIGLHDMKGYDATRIILSKNPKIKIIAQTAYASSSDRAEALHAGCIDHISKPIKEQALLTLLNKYLT